jgi:hypothetical protein
MGKYIEKVDQLEKCNFQQRISTLEGSFNARRDIGAYTQTKSPISLNPKGETLLDASGGRMYVDSNFQKFMEEVDVQQPKSSYDIQELSKRVIKAHAGTDDFTTLKEYIFKEGIELEVLTVVLGIYLRDKILEEKNIDITDVDKTDPKLEMKVFL